MQKWRNILLCAAVSFMFLFMAVGYAQFSDTMDISGTAQWKELEAVYIKEVSISGTRTSGTLTVTKTGTLIFQHGDYSLGKQTNYSSSSVTISVKVKNNSGVDQYLGYHSATTQSDIDKLKTYCIVSYGQSAEDRLIKHGDTKTFTITIQNINKSNSVSMKDFESLLVFSPNFTEDTTMNATDALAKMFANVLAGKGPNGDYGSIIYQGKEITADKILQTIKDKMTGVDTGGYTGNVGNATQAEKDLMEAVFGDNIIIQIGNNYYSVYLLIKNQTIKSKDDMVIYITADQLNMGSGSWQGGSGWGQQGSYVNLNYVPVYGLVFIKEKDGYKYCDHLFAGEAPVCDFGGSFGEGKIGNFNTNLWNSTEFQSVTNTSGGSISQSGISTNGELDEAYQYFIDRNPDSLIDPGTLQ